MGSIPQTQSNLGHYPCLTIVHVGESALFMWGSQHCPCECLTFTQQGVSFCHFVISSFSLARQAYLEIYILYILGDIYIII